MARKSPTILFYITSLYGGEVFGEHILILFLCLINLYRIGFLSHQYIFVGLDFNGRRSTWDCICQVKPRIFECCMVVLVGFGFYFMLFTFF